jgi:cytochrome P450
LRSNLYAVASANIVRVTTGTPEAHAVPPGPKGSLLLGNLREIRRDPLAFLLRASDGYGDVVRLRIAHLPIFLLNDPSDIESVLVTNQKRFVKGRTLEQARRLFGNGLLTSDGEFHASQRRRILPGFHRSRLAAYAGAMARVATEHRERWQAGQVIDVADAMNHLTLAIAGRALFAADLEGIAADLEEAQAIGIGRLEMSLFPFASLRDRLSLRRMRRFRAVRVRLDRVLYELIDRRRRDTNGPDDLLSEWLRAPVETGVAGMTDAQIRDEMMTLLLGGYETTANTLAWTLCLLAQHPDIEARLHAEVDTVLGSRTAAGDDVANLPFTRMVLAEVMRLYPPAWLIGRIAIEDHVAGGYRLRAGSLVIVSPWAIQRSARYFPEPGKFAPDRWLPNRQNGRPRFSYFPFGGGSRGCIGEGFALLEIVLVLATLSQRWKFRLIGPPPRIDPAITLRPYRGMHVKLEARS